MTSIKIAGIVAVILLTPVLVAAVRIGYIRAADADTITNSEP